MKFVKLKEKSMTSLFTTNKIYVVEDYHKKQTSGVEYFKLRSDDGILAWFYKDAFDVYENLDMEII